MSVSINGTNGLTFNDGSAQTTAASGFGFKNRIINGAMVIDQRNAGASVTLSGSTQFTVDRFPAIKQTSAATVTAQRSTVAPAGFTNSLLFTVSTGAAPAAGDINAMWQVIEGFNAADFGWGTANAQSVAMSFWVRSSVTGTYSLSLNNSASNRFYVATYTINAANTWEQKSVTIAGDTSGTWLTDNGAGVQVTWDLGYGSNFNGTAGAWGSSTIRRTSGSVQLIATSGATFYITGVQLEKGSTATSFDYRPYGTELQLAQRYFQKSYNIGTAVGTAATDGQFNHNFLNLGNYGNVVQRFGVCMRASPTMAVYDGSTGASGTIRYWNGTADTTRTTNFALSASEQQLNMADDTFNHTNIIFQWTASAEL